MTLKFFYVCNSHYKAGRGDEDRRRTEAEAIRRYADQLGDVPIIYAGDFNFYAANEPAYDHLLNAPGEGQAVDPLGSDWSNLEVHTQDPSSKMDNRFDFQLVTHELLDGGMDLIVDSYRAFGNDGSQGNEMRINKGTEAPQPVLDALAMADHLPVVADYSPPPIGDSTLDDVFNSSDLVVVFQAGQYENDLADNSNWKTGDWNGDLEFDFGDLVYAFAYGSYDMPTQPVPEPASMAMTCLAVAVLASRWRRSFILPDARCGRRKFVASRLTDVPDRRHPVTVFF